MHSQSIIVNIPQSAVTAAAPEWIRLPASGTREAFTGMTRNVIWRLVKAGLVETTVLKNPAKPAAKKGTRLIRLSSLLGVIEKSAEAGGRFLTKETADSAA
jgi:hypothetical protein